MPKPRLRNLTLRRLRNQRKPRKPKGMGDDKTGSEHANAVRSDIGSILALRKLGEPPEPR